MVCRLYNIFYGVQHHNLIYWLQLNVVVLSTAMCVYGKYNTRGDGVVERLTQHEAKLSAVFASRHPRVLYF